MEPLGWFMLKMDFFEGPFLGCDFLKPFQSLENRKAIFFLVRIWFKSFISNFCSWYGLFVDCVFWTLFQFSQWVSKGWICRDFKLTWDVLRYPCPCFGFIYFSSHLVRSFVILDLCLNSGEDFFLFMIGMIYCWTSQSLY